MFVRVAHAAEVIPVLEKIKSEIINPLLYFVLVLGVVYFLVGAVRFISKLDSEKERGEGKQHLLWGTIGLAIMVSVWGLINLVWSTVAALAS